MDICVFGASSSIIDDSFKDQIKKLGKKIAERGYGLIYGAGASGLMGAVAEGAYEGNGKIIGVVPDFFKDEDMGVDGKLFNHCTQLLITPTMRERKAVMEQRGDAFVVVPGGIGTFEEFFEVFTLKQLGRHNKPIAVLNINGYYDPMFKMLDNAIEHRFIREGCNELIKSFTDMDEMLEYIANYKPKDINVFETKDV